MAIPHEAHPAHRAVVTLSGGVSCWTPGCGLSVVELLNRADEALYQAKSSGRDRIDVAPGRSAGGFDGAAVAV